MKVKLTWTIDCPWSEWLEFFNEIQVLLCAWNSQVCCYLRGCSHSTIKRERRALALEPHISARKCKLWHKLRKLHLPDEMCDICSEFRLARRQMLIVRDRGTSLLEEERIERQQASSKVRLSFLSLQSQKVRHENVQKERRISEESRSEWSVEHLGQSTNSRIASWWNSFSQLNRARKDKKV